MLDEISWLFNLRGSDIEFNPVFFAYALITKEEAIIYVDDRKISDEVRTHLGDAVTIKPYGDIFEHLTTVSTQARQAADDDTTPKKWLVSNRTSWALTQALGGDSTVEVVRSPVEDAKAIKNETEIVGMKECHKRDGVALIKFFSWLETELKNGANLDEWEVSEKLEGFRALGDKYKGLSFDTISSTGANAAIIHYHPEENKCDKVDINEVYLCDSGAQYLDGTTDTTRTLHFGTPRPKEKKAYTLVLKGMIALGNAVFPKGSNGYALDVLARQFLWAQGLDYRHGTGHGVGSFLNVHEGPIGIGTRPQYIEVPLVPGMCISDEPGYYEDGAFGIRIENVVVVKEIKTEFNFGDKP